MVNQIEAEKLAHQHIVQYIEECAPNTPQDVANILMKLSSIAGVLMASSVGCDEAMSRMEGTMDFVHRAMSSVRPSHVSLN